MKKAKNIATLIRECFKGKSLLRTLHNIHCASLPPFEGKGIDYGAKNASSSYYRFLDIANAQMTYTDFYSESSEKVVSIDFEESFDLSAHKYDFALCMNTLEHIYNHKVFLTSVSNSLRDGGHLEGMVPFLHFFHADPNDYFRYTHSALERLLEEAGFEQIEITKVGCGAATVSASMLSRILRFRALILVSWLSALLLDKALNKFWKLNSNIYAGLVFSAKRKNRFSEDIL